MLKLSKRLLTIASFVPYSVTSDIGSDHGKLMIYLKKNSLIPNGYAVENKKGPFDRLKTALRQEEILDYVIPLYSDGISELPSDTKTVVVAGMGGQSIISILKSHIEKLVNVDDLIIDAHSCLAEVREEISKLGYVIKNECIIKEDDMFYEIIHFHKGSTIYYSKEELEFGPFLLKEKNEIFKEKYQTRINEINYLLQKKIPENRKDALLLEKEKLEKLLNEN